MQTLSDIITQHAKEKPTAEALVLDGKSVTWAQFEGRVSRLVRALSQIASPGDRVAVYSETNLPSLDCLYGVPAAGMIVSYVNYRYTQAEYVRQLKQTEPSVIIVQDKYAAAVTAILDELPSVKKVIVIGQSEDKQSYDDFVGDGADAPIETQAKSDDVAWIVYTSGTTGAPKGVMLTHKAIMAAVDRVAIMNVYMKEQRGLYCWPLFHVSAIAVLIIHYGGSPLVVLPGFDPEGWMKIIDEQNVTAASLAPAMLAMILQHPKLADYKLSSLKSLALGSSTFPKTLFQAAVARFGNIVAPAGLGQTEAAGSMLVFTWEDIARMYAGEEKVFRAGGRASKDTQVKIVREDGQECEVDELGEIVYKSDQIMSGYWRDPERTSEVLKDGWLHTGDLGTRDEDGLIYVVDRKDDIIRTGSEKVSSLEVEEALRTNPAILDVAVIGVADVKWGNKITAVAMRRPGLDAPEKEIIDSLRDRLAGYKLPKQIVFVDQLPRNASGKVLKRQLREQYSA